VLGVRPALEHENVTLLTNAKASSSRRTPAGTAVTGVVGRARRRDGDLRPASSSSSRAALPNTARLLLASASDKHPNGLANGSDQVGRNFMFHDSVAVLALSREENATVYQKTLGLNDFYFGSDDFDFPLGNIQMVGKSQSPMFRGEKPGETKLAPEWTLDAGRPARDRLLALDGGSAAAENRVTVDADGKLTLSYSETNAEAKKAALRQAAGRCSGSWILNPGHLFHRFAYMRNDIPVAGCAHQAGTCRFGTDPATSALNIDCRAHEVDNLYVVDTSVFPSIGAVNPALTAMANSLRVGDHLLERLAA
jgi:choline dehydrogenase-like flavoprotein